VPVLLAWKGRLGQGGRRRWLLAANKARAKLLKSMPRRTRPLRFSPDGKPGGKSQPAASALRTASAAGTVP
jgi:hypothetical protein